MRKVWREDEIKKVYHTPLLELIYQAATIHRENHNPLKIHINTLLSLKTGGCSEDCGYCPQSSRHQAKIKVHGILSIQEVKAAVLKAKQNGATKMCLGAAWRQVKNNMDFDAVIEMVKVIRQQKMEVCCTLGMLTYEQAKKLKEAGLNTYNHNIDTSEEFYDKITQTRTYKDRLDTLKNVRDAGISICTGGIIGMGEEDTDRIKMLLTLANLHPQPESVPINALVPVEGTPMGTNKPPAVWDVARVIATARILLPNSIVRLSAGREQFGFEGQALCFLAGANSIFAGDMLLTTANQSINKDKLMFDLFGLQPMQPVNDEPCSQNDKHASVEQNSLH